MDVIFQSTLWQITVPAPWEAKNSEECVEITQPEGAGALHISGAIKKIGKVLEGETKTQLQRNCPEGTESEPVLFGDFVGYGADYVDWSESIYWRVWCLASGRVMLYVTYNCKRGEEDSEVPKVTRILSTLKGRQN
jgi:hypothetical protein